MSYANIDEVRFFLQDHEALAERVRSTGASTTEVMAAISLHEAQRDSQLVPRTVRQQRIADVCSILCEDEEAPIELALDDLEWV